MTKRPRWQALALAACVLVPASASALQLGDPDSLLSIDLHAFVSQGFILSTGNNYLANDTKHGSFQFSELGLNLTKPLTDRLTLGLQFFVQDIGTTGNFNPKIDWFYLDYRFKDWFGIRAGRVKIPFGFYNEVNDIDSARLPILLPQSVYPLVNSTFLLSQTGGELYGYLRLAGAGALDYRAYVGTIFVNTNVATAPGLPYVASLNVPYVAGGRLIWELPVEGLRVGGSGQALRIDGTEIFNGASVQVQIPAILWVASAEYAAHDLLLTAEYSRWYLQGNSDNPSVIPRVPPVQNERAYALAAYRETRWLQTGAYFSLLFPDAAPHGVGPKGTAPSGRQNDLALTLRFDINQYWLVKLEGHYMFGTAGVDPSLNLGVSPADYAQRWGVVLLKTTAYF